MMRLSLAALMVAGLLASLQAAAQMPGLPPERIPVPGQLPSNVQMPGQMAMQPPMSPEQMAVVQGLMRGATPGAMPGVVPGVVPGGMAGQAPAAMAPQETVQADSALDLRPTPPSVALGRLFATPAQREQMNRQRAGMTQATLAAQPSQPGLPPSQPLQQPAPAEPVQLDGVVKSSSGRAIIWLNGQQQPDGASVARHDRAVTLRLSSGRKVRLKPGQRYDSSDGRVKEYNSEP